MKISDHISYAEAIKSQTATRYDIDNTPGNDILENMKHIAENVFEPVREWVGKSIYISSFYRSPALNIKIGGSKTSQHCKGEAIDMDLDIYGGKTNAEVFFWIIDNLQFDQLIYEYPNNKKQAAWIHASLKKGMTNRNQVLLKETNKPYKIFNEEERSFYFA